MGMERLCDSPTLGPLPSTTSSLPPSPLLTEVLVERKVPSELRLHSRGGLLRLDVLLYVAGFRGSLQPFLFNWRRDRIKSLWVKAHPSTS